jgi:hypothetical protein
MMENDNLEDMSLPANRKDIKRRWIFPIKPGYKETPLYARKLAWWQKGTLKIKG